MKSSPSRVQYTAQQAADVLGMSVDELFSLVRESVDGGDDIDPAITFERSDLVVLRVLAGKRSQSF